MAIYKGSTKQNLIYDGSKTIEKICKGSTIVYENKLPAGQILAETATPGTYTLTVPKTQNYYFIAVGAGGGSACGGSGHYTNYNAAGGSGACAAGTIKLTKGTVITYVVGSVGANNSGSTVGNYPAKAGGASTISIPSNAIATANGGGASGGWGNNRHGYYDPGAGGNGGKVIHTISNATTYSNKTIAYTVWAGGIAGTLQYTGKFHGYSKSTKGDDSSVVSLNLIATGGYQGFTMDQGQSTDSQPGTASGGNTFNGVVSEAYPAYGTGAPVPKRYDGGINGVAGCVIFDYYYWK